MPAVSISKQDSLSATFAALSDPTRRAMLKRLSQGEATVNDLAAPFKMSLPAISKHIKVLEKAGLLTKTVQKQQRPCKLNGTKLKQAIDWIDQYKLLWEGRLDRLDEVAKSLQTTETAIAAAAVSSKEEIAADTVKSDLATNLIAIPYNRDHGNPYRRAVATTRSMSARRNATGRSTSTCGDSRMSCPQACSTDSMGMVTATRPSLRRGGGAAATARATALLSVRRPLSPAGVASNAASPV